MFESVNEVRKETPPKDYLGASGDVTPSMSKQSLPYEEKLKRLETENKYLQGRIRGYKTLGDLLQEAKEENKKLIEENRELKSKLDPSTTSVDIHDSLKDNDQIHGQLDFARTQSDVKLSVVTTESMHCESKTGQLNTSVTQKRTEDPQSETISARSINNDCDNVEPGSTTGYMSIREITPMQESIENTQNDLSQVKAAPSDSKDVPFSQNLEFDSDKYEEPETHRAGQYNMYKVPSSSSVSVISSAPDEKYHFPSLSSGTSRRVQDVRPKTYGTAAKAMSSGNLDSEMSLRLRDLVQLQDSTENLHLASQFQKMAEDIANMEMTIKKYKDLCLTYAQENQKMKMSNSMEKSQLRNQNLELRDENKMLMTRIKRLEHDRDDLSVSRDSLTSQTRLVDWVTVERPVRGCDSPSLPDDIDTLMANIRELRKQNKELKVANQSWNKRWQELTQLWEVKVEDMRSEVDRYKQQIVDLQNKEKQLKEDCEKMVQNAKAQAHEEENSKEDALTKLHQSVTLNRNLQEENCDLKHRLESLTRDKHNMEAELGVLKSRNVDRLRLDQSGNQPSNEALKTEIEVLRQQLTVFEEDFARERQDRAAAQSSRDDLKSKLEQAKYDKDLLTRKNTMLDQRMKSNEANIEQILRRNENLQSKVKDLENQNRRLQENMVLRYQNTPQSYPQPAQPTAPGYQAMYQQQPGQVFSQAQMMGNGFVPVSPQQQGFTQPFMNVNNQVPFMPYNGGQQMIAAQTAPIPGHWMCHKCTYANIPSRTVCEICGIVRRMNTQTGYASHSSSSTEPVLMSRDVIHPPLLSKGKDVPDEHGDIVID